MLARDIEAVDLGTENRRRLITLGRLTCARFIPIPDKGPLLVTYRGMRPLEAVDLSSGEAVRVEFMGTSRLDVLSGSAGYSRIIALEENAHARVVGHAQRELEHDTDLVKQLLALARGFASEWRRSIFTYPPGKKRIRIPSYAAVDGAVRLMVPDDSVILLAVTERGRAWASLVLGYRHGEFWLVSSLETLGREDPDLADGGLESAAGGLRAKYAGKVRAIAIEKESLERVLESRFPAGALLWALNTSELRLLDVPWRWKAAALAGALLAGNKNARGQKKGSSPPAR